MNHSQPENAKLDRAVFMQEFTALGAGGMAKKYGVQVRTIYSRRRRLENLLGTVLTAPTRGGHVQQLDQHPAAIKLGIQDGHVLIGMGRGRRDDGRSIRAAVLQLY